MGAYAMAQVSGTCTLIVTLGGDEEKATGGLAIVDLSARRTKVDFVVPTPTPAIGLALSSDNKLAVVAGGDRIYFFDVPKLLAHRRQALAGTITYAKDPGTVSVLVTQDRKLLFASDEGAGKISVLDFASMRRERFKAARLLSSIPVDYAPTVLAGSPDGRWVYVPVQGISRRFNPPILCRSEGGTDATPVNQIGGILTIAVGDSVSNPDRAVVSRAYAGCSPVRLAVTKDGRTIWVTNRLGDTVRALDAGKMRSDPAHAERTIVEVGHQPIGVALLDDDRMVAVANASRWEKDQTTPKTVSLFETQGALERKPDIRSVPVGVFPRDLGSSADGRTLFVSNFASKTLSVVPLAQLRPPR